MSPSWQELHQELEYSETSDQRRLQIGKWLAETGDPRQGIGVNDGIPDMLWLPVIADESIEITRHWHPDTPDGEIKILSRQNFRVSSFYVAKYLVTYAQYQAFVEAEDGFDQLTWWQGMPAAYQPQPLSDQRTQLLNNPRDSISWYQSVAFARWVNHQLQGLELSQPTGNGVLRVGDNAQIRLPTEWEWQWVVQNGTEARVYPWGDRKNGYANTSETGLEQAIAVGMYPQGTAVCGALDMAGNLMEWCANDKVNPEVIDVGSPASKVLRGGDWGYQIDHAGCTYCDDDDPARVDVLNGCRLVLGKPIFSNIT